MRRPSHCQILCGTLTEIAVVTGSSRGIGAAIAKRLAQDGASVVINYASNEAAAKQVADDINAIRDGAAVIIKADVSTVESCKILLDKTLKAFGRIDILVLNAGVMGNKTLHQVDEKFFDESFLVNVKGPFFLVQAAEPHLKEGEERNRVCGLVLSGESDFIFWIGGRIIFFSSSLVKNSAVPPPYLVYVATKGAIEQFSRVLAKELGAKGITVNTVSPGKSRNPRSDMFSSAAGSLMCLVMAIGPVDTALFRSGKSEELITTFANIHPMKRIGTVDEIAPVVAFLASPEAAWVNGQNILINGVRFYDFVSTSESL